MVDLIVGIGLFVLAVGIMLALRMKFGAKLEVKSTDIVIGLIPIVLWMLLTNKISKVAVGDLLTIETVFKAASRAEVSRQVDKVNLLPMQSLRMHTKAGAEWIPVMIQDQSEALSFQLGFNGYQGRAIRNYLDQLTAHPFLKIMLFTDQDGRFAGLADARAVHALLSAQNPEYSEDDLARWIAAPNLEALARLPGFVGRQDALSPTDSRELALEKMETLERDRLPVVDQDKKFLGLLNRDRLTASILIDISKKLK